jgi:hypothetical protein
MSKIVPASMCNVKLNANDRVQSNDWLRSQPVSFMSDATRLLKGGTTSITNAQYAANDVTIKYTINGVDERAAFIAALAPTGHSYVEDDNVVSVTYPKGSIYVNSTNYIYAGDTVYVNLRTNSAAAVDSGDQPEGDMNWYFANTAAHSAGVVASTGSYQLHPVSDYEIVTYAEMCFIKAEVQFRLGNKSEALNAYKAGIQANLDMMQSKLREWESVGYAAYNPDMGPMDDASVSAYINSAAVCQDAAQLTMTDIMLQKYVALGCCMETFNDMRRFNFSAGNIENFGVVYPGYDRSPLFTGQSSITGTTKDDPQYWIRRWRLPYRIELEYNIANVLAMNPNALADNIWSYPVWWDCATDEEYYNYLKK